MDGERRDIRVIRKKKRLYCQNTAVKSCGLGNQWNESSEESQLLSVKSAGHKHSQRKPG